MYLLRKKVSEKPIFKIGSTFKDVKTRIIYTLKSVRPPVPLSPSIGYRISSKEGNDTIAQTTIQQLLKDGDWRKVD